MFEAVAKRSGLKRAAALVAISAVAVPVALGPASPAVAATKPISTTRADQLAAAGVLTGGDLPGWTVVYSAKDTDLTADQLHCGKYVSAPVVAGWTTNFNKGASEIFGGNNVVSTTAGAKSDFKLMRNSKVMACLKHQSLAGDKAYGITAISIEAVHGSVSGADETVVWKVKQTGTLNGVSLSWNSVEIESRVGQTEVNLTVQNTDGTMPSVKKVEGWVHTAVKRVRAA